MLEYRPDARSVDVISAASTAPHCRNMMHLDDRQRDLDGSRAHDCPSSSLPEEHCPVAQLATVTNAQIEKLPPEILGEIFIQCIPADVYNSSAVDSAPLLLLRVCRTWRDVALGTPHLWTKLGLHGLQGVHPVAFISTWLQRSGVLPIDVYISPLSWHYHINLDLFKNSIIPGAVKLLASELHRVRTFHTTNFPAVLQSLFPEGSHINAPRLRHFRITSSPKSSGYVLAGSIAAPNLESLEVCDPQITLQSIAPNYNKLMSLQWNGSNASQSWHASLNHLVPLLRSCPNLEECEVIRPRPFEHFLRPSTGIISLPHLRRLSLLWKETDDIMDFLGLLELPALESLRLETERTTSTRANLQRVLGTLFSSHKPLPPLKELHVTHLDTFMSGDNPSLHTSVPSLNFPALERLHLEDCSVHCAFLAALTPGLDTTPSSWTLPSLTELHVSRADLDGPHLVRMVAARTRCPSPFKVLSLSDCGGLSSLDNAVLRALADRGELVIH